MHKRHQPNQEVEALPDDIRGGQSSQQSHWQAEAEVIRPVSLNIGQPLVHLDAFNTQKKPQICLSSAFNTTKFIWLWTVRQVSHHG